MNTTLPTVKLETPANITAKGDSIWQKTEGTVLVDRASINYRGEKVAITPGSFRAAEFMDAGYKSRQHLSLDVSGPKLLPFWYTDSGAEKAVQAAFKAGLLEATGADDLKLGWSEQGMQGDGEWNFDVNLFWK